MIVTVALLVLHRLVVQVHWADVRGDIVGMPALASASGYAISNLLGFSWLIGSAVRYRIYASFGLDAGTVAAMIALNWSAFWMGGVLILGLLLPFNPAGLLVVLTISPTLETVIGLALLGGWRCSFCGSSRGSGTSDCWGHDQFARRCSGDPIDHCGSFRSSRNFIGPF